MQSHPFHQAAPCSGIAASRWLLRTLFSDHLDSAWVACVADVKDGSQWAGAHLDPAWSTWMAAAGHYYNVTHIPPEATARSDRNSTHGAALFLDDVGDPSNGVAKMDKSWLDLFAPAPTAVIETSDGNYQYVYGFTRPCPIELFDALTAHLKAKPETRGGLADHSGRVRYGRLPSGINPKPGRGRFATRLTEAQGWLYEPLELGKLFGLDLHAPAATDPSTPVQPVSRMDEAEMRALMLGLSAPLQNNGPYDERDRFLSVIANVYGASGGQEWGFDVADEWAATWAQPQTPGAVRQIWDSLHTPRSGADELRGKARDQDGQATVRIVKPFAPIDDVEDDEDADDACCAPWDKLDPASACAAPRNNAALWTPMTVMPGFDRGEVTLVSGKTGAFKSIFALQAGLAVSHTRPDILGLNGHDLDPACQGDTIFLANEDSHDATRMRERAIVKHFRLDTAKDHFPLEIWENQPLFVKNPRTNRITLYQPALARLAAYRARRVIALLIVDTLSASTLGGCEETNPEFQDIANACRRIAREFNLCLVLVHHVRKGSYSDSKQASATLARDDMDGVRGGSTLGNSVRNALNLSKPTKEEILVVGEDTAHDLTRLTMAKRSNGPRAKPTWFRLKTEPVLAFHPMRPNTPVFVNAITLENVSGGLASLAAAHRSSALIAALARIRVASEVYWIARQRLSRRPGLQQILEIHDTEAHAIFDDLLKNGLIETTEIPGRGRPLTRITLSLKGRNTLDEYDQTKAETPQ